MEIHLPTPTIARVELLIYQRLQHKDLPFIKNGDPRGTSPCCWRLSTWTRGDVFPGLSMIFQLSKASKA
jgi:hypothetical protein